RPSNPFHGGEEGAGGAISVNLEIQMRLCIPEIGPVYADDRIAEDDLFYERKWRKKVILTSRLIHRNCNAERPGPEPARAGGERSAPAAGYAAGFSQLINHGIPNRSMTLPN